MQKSQVNVLFFVVVKAFKSLVDVLCGTFFHDNREKPHRDIYNEHHCGYNKRELYVFVPSENITLGEHDRLNAEKVNYN